MGGVWYAWRSFESRSSDFSVAMSLCLTCNAGRKAAAHRKGFASCRVEGKTTSVLTHLLVLNMDIRLYMHRSVSEGSDHELAHTVELVDIRDRDDSGSKIRVEPRRR